MHESKQGVSPNRKNTEVCFNFFHARRDSEQHSHTVVIGLRDMPGFGNKVRNFFTREVSIFTNSRSTAKRPILVFIFIFIFTSTFIFIFVFILVLFILVFISVFILTYILIFFKPLEI